MNSKIERNKLAFHLF